MRKKKIIIAGKNDIAVNVLMFLADYPEKDFELGVICNKTESGVNGWQKSLRYYANKYKICEYQIEEIYECSNLILLSLEFDQIININRFKDARLYNIHFSLLPAYKGMYTAVMPILNREKYSGVTFHEIDAGIDTGDIIKQKAFEIDEEWGCRDLYFKCLHYGTELVKECLPEIIEGTVKAKKQEAKGASYYSSKAVDYSNLKIDLHQTAEGIQTQIRAFNFREYQLPEVKGYKIVEAIILGRRSNKKAGTLLREKKSSIEIASIDYDLELYIDRFDELMRACEEGELDVIKEICVVKRYIREKNERGWSPIIVATFFNRIEVVDYLLERGADVHDKNINGTNLLMYAKEAYSRYNDNTLFKKFYELGVSETEKDYSGKNVLDYIRIEGIKWDSLIENKSSKNIPR